MGAPLLGVAPIFALSFTGFGIGKRLQQSDPNEALNLGQLAVAGGFSGILTTVIMAPGERIKCLLQVRIIIQPNVMSCVGDEKDLENAFEFYILEEKGTRTAFHMNYLGTSSQGYELAFQSTRTCI